MTISMKEVERRLKALHDFTHKWDSEKLREAAKVFNKKPEDITMEDFNRFMDALNEVKKKEGLTEGDKKLAAKFILSFKKWVHEGRVKKRPIP